MTRRWLFAACIGAFAAFAQTQQSPPQQSSPPPTGQAPPPVQVPDESSLPEEDEEMAPEKFVLNPLESERNIKIGDFYWHKSKYRAALRRYEWATKYNPSSAEAFYKVGEAEQKLKNRDAAKLAFQKVMTLAPDSKLAKEAKKKMSKS